MLALLQLIEDIVGPGRAIDNLGSIEVAIIEGERLEMKVLLVLSHVVQQDTLEGIGDDEAILGVIFRLVLIVDAAVVSKGQAIRVVVDHEALEELPSREEAIVHCHLGLVDSAKTLELPLLVKTIGKRPEVPEGNSETSQIGLSSSLPFGIGRL